MLYGFTEPNKLSESAINILYERVAKTNEAFVVDHAQVRFPTHTIDVARFLAQLIIKHVQVISVTIFMRYFYSDLSVILL